MADHVEQRCPRRYLPSHRPVHNAAVPLREEVGAGLLPANWVGLWLWFCVCVNYEYGRRDAVWLLILGHERPCSLPCSPGILCREPWDAPKGLTLLRPPSYDKGLWVIPSVAPDVCGRASQLVQLPAAKLPPRLRVFPDEAQKSHPSWACLNSWPPHSKGMMRCLCQDAWFWDI